MCVLLISRSDINITNDSSGRDIDIDFSSFLTL
jgi:hypothetical protein